MSGSLIDGAPVTLNGNWVRLESPPTEQHAAALLDSAQYPEIWQYLPFGPYNTLDDCRAIIRRWIDQTALGKSRSFAINRQSDHRVIGMTAYLDIQPKNRALEIGATWLVPDVWRTAINTECKYLLLRRAFEDLGCLRVQLKTDARNLRSRRAIERLGAVKEGVLRKHILTRDDYQRDTVLYSIVDTEWPGVKARLEGFLRQTKDA